VYISSSLSGEAGFNTPLLVFANMPGLQHLELRSGYRQPVATAAEVAALSASSNLTYLSLSSGEYGALPQAAYDSWFPAGCQCPYLQHVDVGVGLLGNTAAVQRMASACPGLKELELQNPDFPEVHLESANVVASLHALANLTSLTGLRVEGRDLPKGSCISPTVIAAWSRWTSLQQLELYHLEYRKLVDVLVLTQLRSLRTLSITGLNGGQCDTLCLKVGVAFASDCMFVHHFTVLCQAPQLLLHSVNGLVTRPSEQVVSRMM